MPFSLDFEKPGLVFTTLALSSALKFTFGLVTWKRKQREYELIGKVSEINTYPIKACGGFGLNTAEVTRLGIQVNGTRDRHWLVVKPNGDFLTQRQYPQLAVVKTSCKDKNLVIKAPGMKDLEVPIKPKFDRSKVMRCRVWNNHLAGQDCGEEASQWFSKWLNTDGIRLLFSAPDLAKSHANSRKNAWGNIAQPGDQAAYQDECCAYMIMNQQSLIELNKQLLHPVTFKRFRPNIVIEGAEGFDEDNWTELLIGENINMRILEPCTRCQVTTVDQDKGIKNEDGEPLKTLSTFRCYPKYGKAPLFGILGTVDEPGIISIGDPVFAIRK